MLGVLTTRINPSTSLRAGLGACGVPLFLSKRRESGKGGEEK